MNYEYRLVLFSENVLQIRKIILDNSGAPIQMDPEELNLSAENLQEMVGHVLLACASLTKPVLDVNMFVKHDINEASKRLAELRGLTNKND
jgi:hypothetical protein